MARVFVSGGSGFIGGALVGALQESGKQVVALGHTDASVATLTARGVEVVPGDVRDEDVLAAAMSGCELAFNVAGINSHCPEDPGLMLAVNIDGATAAVRAAGRAGVPRLIHTSSAASIGEAHGTVGSEDSPHRGSYLSVYDRSKHEGERAAFEAGRTAGVEVIAICPSSVQGPGRASGNGKIIIDYLNGRLPVFVRTHVSVVDVADCVQGHLLAAQRGVAGERYVLNGATITTAEALEVMAAVSGVRERVRMLPRPAASGAAAVAEAAFRARGKTCPFCRARVRTILHGHRYDGSRAQRELGLEYRPVAETFERTIRWAVSEGLVQRPTALRD